MPTDAAAGMITELILSSLDCAVGVGVGGNGVGDGVGRVEVGFAVKEGAKETSSSTPPLVVISSGSDDSFLPKMPRPIAIPPPIPANSSQIAKTQYQHFREYFCSKDNKDFFSTSTELWSSDTAATAAALSLLFCFLDFFFEDEAADDSEASAAPDSTSCDDLAFEDSSSLASFELPNAKPRNPLFFGSSFSFFSSGVEDSASASASPDSTS